MKQVIVAVMLVLLVAGCCPLESALMKTECKIERWLGGDVRLCPEMDCSKHKEPERFFEGSTVDPVDDFYGEVFTTGELVHTEPIHPDRALTLLECNGTAIAGYCVDENHLDIDPRYAYIRDAGDYYWITFTAINGDTLMALVDEIVWPEGVCE